VGVKGGLLSLSKVEGGVVISSRQQNLKNCRLVWLLLGLVYNRLGGVESYVQGCRGS
jgi:hypothetical protein